MNVGNKLVTSITKFAKFT